MTNRILRQNRVRYWSASLGLWMLAVVGPAGAQAPPEKVKPVAQDPAAVALSEKGFKAYRALHSYRAKVTQKQWKTDPAEASLIKIETRFRRPNRFYLKVDYPNVGKPGRWYLLWACDGKNLTFYNSARNEFERVKAPAKLDKLVLANALRGPEFEALLRDSNPFESIEKSGIARFSTAYEQKVGGAVNILQIALQQEGANRTLRYAFDPKDFLIRALSLRIVPNADTPSPFLEMETVSHVEAEYTQVEANPHLVDSDFAFTPPSDATEKSRRGEGVKG